jgi:hypothetical protein
MSPHIYEEPSFHENHISPAEHRNNSLRRGISIEPPPTGNFLLTMQSLFSCLQVGLDATASLDGSGMGRAWRPLARSRSGAEFGTPPMTSGDFRLACQYREIMTE